jgi:nitroreductase
MAHRRSVRRYKDRPVPREVLQRVVEAVRWAPTASGRNITCVIVIDEPELLKEFSKHVYALYDKVEKALGNPIARFVMTRRAGKRNVETLKRHVMPGMRWYKRWYEEGRSDEILRDCPVVMLVHAPLLEPSADESCVIATWHAVLMAETLGLGTCFNGMIPPACNKIPELRKMLQLPDDHEVFTSLTIGYPKYPFKKTIRRQLGEVRYLSD